MPRKFFMSFMLVVGGLLCGLLIAELLLMIFKPQPVYVTEAPRIFFIRHDPLLGWANLEGAQGVYEPHPAIPRSFVKINQEGYRGELLPEKKPGRHRVLFLGDSNTFGYGVEEKERFSEIVSARSKGAIEQINLGIFGYSTDQEALLLESKGMSYRPDTLVLAVSAGDLSDVMTSVNGGASKPFFKLFGDRLMVQNTPVPKSIPYISNSAMSSSIKMSAYQYSHLYRLLLMRLMSSNQYMRDSVVEMNEGDALNVMMALLTGIRDISRETGVRFVVLLIPHGVWLDSVKSGRGDMPGYFPVFKKLLAQQQIETLDPAEALIKAMNGGQQVFFKQDPVHLTAQGNAVVASFLYPYLAAPVAKR